MSQPATVSQSTPTGSTVTANDTAKNAGINDPNSTTSPGVGSSEGGLRDPNAEITPEQAQAEGLPEQKHAGAVGYGPSYANKDKPTIGEKITGVKEQLVGKLTKNPELVQKGHEKKTGELKKKEQAENEIDPFAKPEDKRTNPGNDDDAKGNTGSEPLGGGKSSVVDTAAGQGRLTEDLSHPAAQDENVQRAGTV